jgi:hypothetical protein
MTESLAIIAAHCARTLPDSIDERKRVLRALTHVLTDAHPALAAVRGQLASLAAIERFQEELPMHFDRGVERRQS